MRAPKLGQAVFVINFDGEEKDAIVGGEIARVPDVSCLFQVKCGTRVFWRSPSHMWSSRDAAAAVLLRSLIASAKHNARLDRRSERRFGRAAASSEREAARAQRSLDKLIARKK